MEKEKYISLDEAFKAVLGYVISNIELLEKTVSQSEKGELVVREEKGMDFDREGEFYNRETFIFRREWFKYALSAKSPGDCLRALIVLLKYGFDRELPPYDSGEFANGILEIAQNQIEEDWRRYEEKLDRKLENRLELEHKKERMANLPLSPEEEKFAKIFGDGTEWQKYEIRAIMQFIWEI